MPTPAKLLDDFEERFVRTEYHFVKKAKVIKMPRTDPFAEEELGNFLYKLHLRCLRLSGQSIFSDY